jgi:hypothetical protein
MTSSAVVAPQEGPFTTGVQSSPVTMTPVYKTPRFLRHVFRGTG